MNALRGFIALTSVLILSALLLVILVGSGMRMLYARFGLIEDEAKARSREAALSCIESIRLRLIEDEDYAGGDSLDIGGMDCEVGPSTSHGTEKTFTVAVAYQNANTIFSISIDRDSAVASEQEIPSASD